MPGRIPNVFHFVYGLKPQIEPMHLVHYLALASCLAVNRPERVLLHFHYRPWGEYWDRIAPQLELHRVPRPRVRLRYADRRVEAYRYAHESDFVRLDALIEHGGIYADIDTIFTSPVPARLFDERFVLGREGDLFDVRVGAKRRSLCNAFMMAEPGAEFARIWRDRMAGAFDGSWSRHSTLLPSDLADAHPTLLHVEPSRTFYPYMWRPDELHRLFEEAEAVDGDVASIHLWAHLWWAESRRDFSDFHAGLVTEDFVRSVDTTYNRLARPFLPPATRDRRRVLRRVRDLGARGIATAQNLPTRVRRVVRRLTERTRERPAS